MTDPVRTTVYIQIEYQSSWWPLRLVCPWLGRDWRSYWPSREEDSETIYVGDDVLSIMFEDANITCRQLSEEERRPFRLTGRWRVMRRAFYSDIPPVDCEILIGNRHPP